MKLLDIIYVINIEHRVDRMEGFRYSIETLELEDKVERINANYHPSCPPLGCARSHLMALEAFEKSSHQYALICEDDIRFIVPSDFTGFFEKLENEVFEHNFEFDVIMLMGDVNHSSALVFETEVEFLNKANAVHTASCYLVNRVFLPTLIECFRNCVAHLESIEFATYQPATYEIDQYWKNLQPVSNWYVADPVIGKHEPGYSDICKGDVDYGF
jgi:GR25 family glycosyltransferase involved in LPS biosynthesis